MWESTDGASKRSFDEALRARWKGEARFFEIWFAVIFSGDRALWVRQTTFGPSHRATVWAAAFEPGRTIRLKDVFDLGAYVATAHPFSLRIGDARLDGRSMNGAARDPDHSIAWDLEFEPEGGPRSSVPRWLARLPTPTHAVQAIPRARVRGSWTVDGKRHDAIGLGLLQHLWGTRRVDELLWLACLDLGVEATFVRPRRDLPFRIAMIRVDGFGDFESIVRHRIESPRPGQLRVMARSVRRAVCIHAECTLESLAAWDYRDPSGHDIPVAQSDVGRCEMELLENGKRIREGRSNSCALEFHGTRLEGVDYLPW